MLSSFNFRATVSRLALCAAFLSSGCAVGPDFEAPMPPAVAGYDSEATPVTTADDAQSLTLGADIPAQWWQLYRSEPLNELIERALANNPNIATAEASLRAANASLSAASAAFLPAIDASFAAARQQIGRAHV
jgi:outer membrane protein TolC